MLLQKKLSLPLVILMSIFLASGCASQKKKEGGEETKESDISMEGQNEGLNLELNADSDSGEAGPLQTVNFPFDSSRLRSEAKSKLQSNAEFLKNNPSVEVQVEGHCDERGGVQYNLALGERRAESVKDYLVALGVDADRLSTISFGKERPIAFGHNEEAWAQNRRANFVVTSK